MRLAVLLLASCAVLESCPFWEGVGLAQQLPATQTTQAPQSQVNLFGAQGFLWFSQFANPALLGSLYLTPNYPLTGYYPIYPGGVIGFIETDGIKVGPVRLHPSLGIGEMYTDNVFRTSSGRTSDWIHALAPSIQVRLPFGYRHQAMFDYRTNLLYFERTPVNDVSDQTATARTRFEFPGGLKLDFQGQHKVGHDPRGTAVDIQAVEVNKWRADSLSGIVEYQGAQANLTMNLSTSRFNYTNNSLDIFDRRNNYTALTFSGALTAKTSILTSIGASQTIYDQNKNLDNTIYLFSGGVRWQGSELTSGELLLGYQYLKFSNAQVNQPGPVLSQFTRNSDSSSNFYVAGNLSWTPLSYVKVSLQPYRTFQQTVSLGTVFFVATGMNLAMSHYMTERTTVNLNFGVENDKFTGGTGTVSQARTDTIKNAALGLTYKTTRYLGTSLQYAYEDRTSNSGAFVYHANTVTLSLQGGF